MPAFDAYTKADASVAQVVDTAGAPDLEKIAALRPDLIITSDWKDPKQQQQPYTRLAEIAPTVVFEWQKAAGNWRAEAQATAAAVGRSARLDALKKSYTDTCASIRTQYAKVLAATRWDMVDGNGSVWDLYGPTSSHGHVLTDAGVRLAAGATQKDGFVEHSLEDMPDLLGGTDVLLTTGVSLSKLRTEQVFKQLPAVRHSDLFTSDLFFPASYGIAIALLADVRKTCAQLATRI
jgi:iron complex transport system substrate-binding protein